MTQPKIPKEITIKGYIYGRLYPGDDEAYAQFFTYKPDNNYFFIREFEVTLDLPFEELNPVTAQIEAIREGITAARGEFECIITEKNAEINKLLSLTYSESAHDLS